MFENEGMHEWVFSFTKVSILVIDHLNCGRSNNSIRHSSGYQEGNGQGNVDGLDLLTFYRSRAPVTPLSQASRITRHTLPLEEQPVDKPTVIEKSQQVNTVPVQFYFFIHN